MSKPKYAYTYTSSAKKFGDKMLQSYSFSLISSANRAIYGVKDSMRHLLITNNRKE